MNEKTLRSVIGLVLAMAGLVATTVGSEAQYFRIVSTQQTHIVSIDCQGLISWVNSMSNAPCWIEARNATNGNWTSNFPSTTLQCTGLVARARVPLFAKAGEIIVGFQDNVSEAQADSLVQSYGLVWQSRFPRIFGYWVKVLRGAPTDYIPSLESSDIVLWADERGTPGGDPGVSYILVKFNMRATQETAQQLIASFPGLQLDSMLVAPKFGLVYVPAGSEHRWIAQFQTHQEVRFAQLNGIMILY